MPFTRPLHSPQSISMPRIKTLEPKPRLLRPPGIQSDSVDTHLTLTIPRDPTRLLLKCRKTVASSNK